MTMNSKRNTAVGMVAVCAAASTTTSATLISPLSVARASSAWTRAPRGGASAAESSAEANFRAANDEKKRKKKKKRTGKHSASADNAGPLPPAAAAILTETSHYGVLGVATTATSAEIQKAYRRKCVLTHPDKTGGDRSAFDRVSTAYNVLSCEEKRVVYDRSGADGLEDVDVGAAGGGGGAAAFFGNDVFRDFFGAADPFFGRRAAGGSHPFRRAPPRNRDLRYQLEVTLEELYAGTTKRVAISQPDPLRPHFPLRKELEVDLPPGLAHGKSVRLSGVVDSVPDAAPADIVFLVKQRRHALYTRRGADLALKVTISLAEAIVGFRREVPCLDGRRIVIGSPFVRHAGKVSDAKDDGVTVDEVVMMVHGDADANINATHSAAAALAEGTPPPAPLQECATNNNTVSYELPPVIIRLGDVHVLKGHGMPKEGAAHHREYGDLYVQYEVATPAGGSGTSASAPDIDNLCPEERVELARLLSKLEGQADPTAHAVRRTRGQNAAAARDGRTGRGEGDSATSAATVHHLAVAAARDFGSSTDPDDAREDERRGEEGRSKGMPAEDAGEFFQRMFGARAQGFGGGPFGFGGGDNVRYFSSSSGRSGYGHRPGGEERGEQTHQMECNQM